MNWACEFMNSTEAIISPTQRELLEFLTSLPCGQQVPSSQTITEGIFVVYSEDIFMLNLIFQYFATSSKDFVSFNVEFRAMYPFFERLMQKKKCSEGIWWWDNMKLGHDKI